MAFLSGRSVAILLMILGGLQVLLGGQFQGLWLVLIGLFLRRAVVRSARELEVRRALQGVRVMDAMEPLPAAIPSGTGVQDAAEEHFLRGGSSSFPVSRHGAVLGLVDVGAIQDVPAEERANTPIDRVMTPIGDLPVVESRHLLGPVLGALLAAGRESLPVRDEEGRLIGQITRAGVERLLRVRGALLADGKAG